ncbi:MAG: hypothetical protein ACXVB9_00665 [Bdellovibrionota bacterium]
MAKRGIRKGAQGLLGDVLRKVPLPGGGELRVPTDIRRALVQNIEKVRESAVDVFAKEISKVLAKIDVHNIVEDVLQNYSLRIEARIDLTPKAGSPAESRKAKK